MNWPDMSLSSPAEPMLEVGVPGGGVVSRVWNAVAGSEVQRT